MAGTGWWAHARSVVAPDGREWSVRRAVLPRLPRFRGWRLPWRRQREETAPVAGAADWNDWRVPDDPKFWSESSSGKESAEALWFAGDLASGLDSFGAAIVAGAAAIAVLAFAWIVIFPVLVFAVDVLIFLLIAAGGIAMRVLFRRPWLIEWRTDGPPRELHTWGVVGLRTSAQAVETVAEALRRGTPPQQIRPAPRFR
jgi:hypothetical protein